VALAQLAAEGSRFDKLRASPNNRGYLHSVSNFRRQTSSPSIRIAANCMAESNFHAAQVSRLLDRPMWTAPKRQKHFHKS
jgi:hypothetical protein